MNTIIKERKYFINEFGYRIRRSQIDKDILSAVDSVNNLGFETIESGGIIGNSGEFNPYLIFKKEGDADKVFKLIKDKTKLKWKVSCNILAPKENWLLTFNSSNMIIDPSEKLINNAKEDIELISKALKLKI